MQSCAIHVQCMCRTLWDGIQYNQWYNIGMTWNPWLVSLVGITSWYHYHNWYHNLVSLLQYYCPDSPDTLRQASILRGNWGYTRRGTYRPSTGYHLIMPINNSFMKTGFGFRHLAQRFLLLKMDEIFVFFYFVIHFFLLLI